MKKIEYILVNIIHPLLKNNRIITQIKDFNIVIDRKSFFDVTVNNEQRVRLCSFMN